MVTKLFDFIKRTLFWFWNPKTKPVRDSTGKVIDDWARRKHSKEIQNKIDNGELKPKGESPRCYKIESKGKVVLVKQGQK